MISSISSHRKSLLAKAAADAAIIPIQAFSLLQAIGAVLPRIP
jgi:hypothetical protein